MSECGDKAIINVNDGPGAIMVESWMEDSRISGFATSLHLSVN